MKVDGLGSMLRSRPYTLVDANGNTKEITITAPALGFLLRFRREVPEPIAERRVRADASGKIISSEPMTDDPKHVLAQAEDTNAYHAALILEGLRREPSITFDAVRGQSAKDYYLAVYKEIEEAGFSSQQITALVSEIVSIGALTDAKLREAKGFLDPKA